ncbi:hypothetical protein [Winogradskyella wichelsiae]|uniref:hypothetical protein n=1 Tax=Winogradskyella wichelsiae TaxID=2697007 RepID=UPI003F4AE6C7
MKNKIFSLLAVVLFTTILMSVAPEISDENPVSCTDVAIDTHNKMRKKGYNHLTSNDAADAAYDSCVDNGGSPN